MSTFDDSPRKRAGWLVREHVRRVAVDAFDATEVEQPIDGFPSTTRACLDDPLAGVQAALLVLDVACGQLREYALRARGAGRSWDDVADALALPDGIQPRDGAAYEWLVEHRPPEPVPACHRGTVWRCTACRSRVRDTGPFADYPDDREAGHAPGCARHAAAVTAWRHRIEDHDTETEEWDR